MRTRSTRAGVVGGLVAACLIGGAVYGAVQIAGATAPGTTFYACLAGGKLTKVATVAPTCVSPATQISWDSAGPQGTPGDTGTTGTQGVQGPVGPQGLSSAQYVGENAWAGTNSGSSGAFPSIPAGKTLTITSVSGPYGVTCTISGTLNGNPYSFNSGGSSGSLNSGQTYWGAILPQNVGGLQWSFSSGTTVQGSCTNGGSVSASGYLS